MSLKEVMQKEALTVFLNMEEFAEEMTINSEPMPALWDSTQQAIGGASQSDPTGWGLASSTSVLFVAEAHLPCPMPDEELMVNGERYTVIKATPQGGLIRMELERRFA